MSATFRGSQDSWVWKELYCVLLVENASVQIRLDNSRRFVFHSSCSVRRPTNRFTPALAIQRICHRFSGFASHSGYLDLVRYIVCRAKVLDDRRSRMVFHPVGHFRCCIRGSNRQYHEDISDGSKTPAPDKKTNWGREQSSIQHSERSQMQKVSCHCTLYLRLVYDMLCPFLWNSDHRHAPSIYDQDTNRLWFLWDCYFRQLLYKSGRVLLENSGDKKSCKEHSKGVGWGTEWIIPPLLEAKMISSMPIWGSKGGDGYGKQCWRTIGNTPFQCGAGSNPDVDHIYVGWVCCWFSPLLWEVFLRVLKFSPLLKTNSFKVQFDM